MERLLFSKKVQLRYGESYILGFISKTVMLAMLNDRRITTLYPDGIESKRVPIFKLSQILDVTHETTSTRFTRTKFLVVPPSAITTQKSEGELFPLLLEI